MKFVTVSIFRDASTTASREVPDYEVEVLNNLHGAEAVIARESRDATPREEALFADDIQAAHDTLIMKYKQAAREDRGPDTGHPALQIYRNAGMLERAVKVDKKKVEEGRAILEKEKADEEQRRIARDEAKQRRRDAA